MKRCRCCRERFPVTAFAVARRDDYRVNGRRVRRIYRRATCDACRAGCKSAAQRYYARNREACIARTKTYRERLRAEVALTRVARAA